MTVIGLEVRRIVANPTQKKS